jgi:hypothetical protein
MITLPIIPTLFFVGYKILFKGINSRSYFLLATNNLGCAQSMCVLVYRNRPITLVVFYKLSFYNKITFNQNIFICLFRLVNNASQHLWVHNVNKEVIINNKKTPTNG